MADSDKILGVGIKNDDVTRTYSEYRIDYDSEKSIQEISGYDAEVAVEDYYGGSVKNPPAGYSGHEAKDGYQRKVLVENEAARDAVTADLDEAGISYEVESVSVTTDEKEALAQWGAMNGLEAAKAMKWKRAVEALDSGKIGRAEYERGENPHEGESFKKPQ